MGRGSVYTATFNNPYRHVEFDLSAKVFMMSSIETLNKPIFIVKCIVISSSSICSDDSIFITFVRTD